MNRKTLFLTGCLLAFSLLYSTIGFSKNSSLLFQDTCMVNDICQTAIPILNVISDSPFTCIEGCTVDALPEAFNTVCGIGVHPTVWYRVQTDFYATLMNIYVGSDEIQQPIITLFRAITDCDSMQLVWLTQSNLSCISGMDGEAEAIATDVYWNEVYYIAVSSYAYNTGTFELCVNTIATGSSCVNDRNIEITGRSKPGPLTGPFEPGETVSVCFNVNNFSASGNGCQWFQGLVPVFGNGWDYSSFNGDGQPVNTTLNGNGIGHAGNGLYDAATWDWFTDVDYHFDNSFLQLGDFDGNGMVDLCNLLYEVNCPNTGGLSASCCGPCWGAPLGTILPGGWFAYGINGTCPTPGPPIRVDWGDGNSCGALMGPWRFCFELTTREYPDCLEDPTTRDLSLGFFTFADGEVGSWTGSASVCALDQPVKLTLPLKCGVNTDIGSETLPDICEGDTLYYQIEEPGIHHWEWTISPHGYVVNPIYEGENGFVIKTVITNPLNSPRTVTFEFTGYIDSSMNTVTKRVSFTVWPEIRFSLPADLTICERSTQPLIITPQQVSGGQVPYTYIWSPGGETSDTLLLFPPFQPLSIELAISDEIGCFAKDVMHLKLKPCLQDTIGPADDNNEMPTEENPPPPDGNIISPSSTLLYRSTAETPTHQSHQWAIKVYPVPARDKVFIELNSSFGDTDRLVISNSDGKPCLSFGSTDFLGSKHMIDTDILPDGVYFVTLYSGKEVVTARLVKM